ncbi:MAG: hypothetical protein HY553_03820 [Elusimicrobia bacterium]|nr:hypothetical protein [Elusimicrobiota bacterium]
MNDFALELKRQRESEGFSSARSFYRARGGPSLGCTYKAYLNIEAGRSVPQPALALRIAAVLGVSAETERARAYVSAYLRGLVGRHELGGFLLRALGSARGPAAKSTPFQRATDIGFEQKTIALTRRQADFFTADADRYWCWSVLSDDGGRWLPARLARLLGAPERRIKGALEGLAREGLLSREGPEFYCEDAGKVFKFPRANLYVPDHRKALRAHWSAMAERRGRTILKKQAVLRSSEAALRRAFAYLVQTVNGLHIYSTTEPSTDTGLFVGTAVVRRLPGH